jgi:hypothetical protein
VVQNFKHRPRTFRIVEFIDVGTIHNSFRSSARAISYGVPHGSILGPLLFLIYISDLPLNIQGAKLILYADDTNVLVVDRNEEALHTKLSLVVKQLENWFLKNYLFINITKTVAMSFYLCRSKPPFKPRILLRNTEVEYMPEVKFLRRRITENLSWLAHICSLCHSLTETFFIMKL